MLLRGVVSVALGDLRLHSAAARVGCGKSQFVLIGGRPKVCRGEIYKACSLYILCVNLRSLCVERACLSICCICNI